MQVKALLTPRQAHPVVSRPGEFRLNLKSRDVNRAWPYPLLQFVFVMQTDEGYYRWLTQPANGHLSVNEDETFRKLDNQAISEIMTEVSMWHENSMKIPA
jgi:hypothetical protein